MEWYAGAHFLKFLVTSEHFLEFISTIVDKIQHLQWHERLEFPSIFICDIPFVKLSKTALVLQLHPSE